MKQKDKKSEEPHNFKYWFHRFIISFPLVAFVGILLGEYKGNPFLFLIDILQFSLIITILLAISDMIWKKWGNKNFLFRKVF